MTDLRSAALEYGDQGIAIMPCHGKKPALGRTGKEHGVAVSDADQIDRWWTHNPKYNIGIVSTANKLAVIDIDGAAGIEWIRDNRLPMPATWTATTARGFHYYYRWPMGGARIKTCQIAPKLEIRAAGAYVIAPPSIHPDGDIYQWSWGSDRCDWDALPALPPEWVALQPLEAPPDNVTYLKGSAHRKVIETVKMQLGTYLQESLASNQAPPDNTVALKRLNGLAGHLAATPKGGRHQTLYTIARTLGQLVASNHVTHPEIHNALYAAADVNGLLAEDGDHNITQTIEDGITKGISDGPDPGHHETAEHNPYILTPPPAVNMDTTDDGDGIHALDLDKVITAEFDDTQWLIEPVVPANRAAALYAAGKTGKSLLILDLVAAAASGRNILGGVPLEAPIRILYVDQEMTQPDLQERLHSLGYEQPDQTLTKAPALLPTIALATTRHPRRRTATPQRSPQRQRATRRHRHPHPHRRRRRELRRHDQELQPIHRSAAQGCWHSSPTHRPRRQRPHPRTTWH